MITSKRQNKIDNVIQRRQQGIIVLEDVHDPHNAAATMRSVEALGFQTVYFTFDKTKRYNPVTIGKASSASAVKWLTIETFDSSKSCYQRLKQDGYIIYETTLNPIKPYNVYDKLPTLGPKIAIVFGNEHAGLSSYAVDNADYHLFIPMRGFVESFNISVCAALMLAEISRKRVEEGIGRYLLTKDQTQKLSTKWK